MTPLDDELDRVDTKAGTRWNLPHLGADQGEDAGRIATGNVAQRRWKCLPRLLQGATSLLADTHAPRGNGPVHASGHRAVAQQVPHFSCGRGNAAGGMKEDWQLVLADLR